jgi:hypothetical protein
MRKLETTEKLAAQATAILTAIRTAVQDALLMHKRAGNPIAVCDDGGKVRWIPAAEIPVADPLSTEPAKESIRAAS